MRSWLLSCHPSAWLICDTRTVPCRFYHSAIQARDVVHLLAVPTVIKEHCNSLEWAIYTLYGVPSTPGCAVGVARGSVFHFLFLASVLILVCVQ